MADRFVKTTHADGIITFAFPTTDLAPIVLDTNKVHEAVKARACVHGFIQTCSDPAASKKTAAEKRAAIAARVEWLQDADAWTPERKGGPVGPRIATGDIVTALASRYYDGDVDKTNAKVSRYAVKLNISRDEALMKLYRDDADITADVAKLMRLRAKPAVSANATLDEMDEEETAE